MAMISILPILMPCKSINTNSLLNTWSNKKLVNPLSFIHIPNGASKYPPVTKLTRSINPSRLPNTSNVHREFGFLRAQINRYSSHSNQLVTRHNKRHSRFRWILTTNGVITCLFLTNMAVFLLWKVADREFMSRNFTLHLDKLKSGRYHTVITSAFSHIETVHFLGNMFIFCFCGRRIEQMLGPRFLLKLYFAGAFSGSFFVLAQQAFLALPLKDGQVIKDKWGTGSNASVKSIVMLDVFLYPRSAVSIAMMTMMFAYDLLVLCEEIIVNNEKVEGFSYLGGDVIALMAWACLRKRPYIYY